MIKYISSHTNTIFSLKKYNSLHIEILTNSNFSSHFNQPKIPEILASQSEILILISHL